jgi:3-isopropylmalate dehydratase
MAAAAAVTGKLTDVRTLPVLLKDGDAKIKVLDSKTFVLEEAVTIAPAATPAVAASAATTTETASTTATTTTTTTTTSSTTSPASSGGMQPFRILKGTIAPLEISNVDTDMIIPKQFLKTIKRTGLGAALFHALRYNHSDGSEKPDFILNQQPYRSSKILVAGENFGCGSSREHAPWALLDFGIRCVISESFADIFFNNCFKNGMLPVILTREEVAKVMAHAKNQGVVEVDLEVQKVKLLGSTGTHDVLESFGFTVDELRKRCLFYGLDDIGLTLEKAESIAKFEEKRSRMWPWLDGPGYVPGKRAGGGALDASGSGGSSVKSPDTKKAKVDW